MTLLASEFPERAFRITRDTYRKMAEQGLFQRHRVELIHGQVVEMSPQNVPIARAIQKLSAILQRALPEGVDVRVQLPAFAPDDSEPEPDLFVVRDDPEALEHPKAALLVIEVADSSLAFDRRVKLPLYAEMGVPEFWLVNLPKRRIEVYDQLRGAEYTQIRMFGEAEEVPVGAFPEVRVPVAAILTRP